MERPELVEAPTSDRGVQPCTETPVARKRVAHRRANGSTGSEMLRRIGVRHRMARWG